VNLFFGILLDIINDNILAIIDFDSNIMESKDHPNKWTGIEILRHLIDSAHHNHRRFTMTALQDHLIFDGYDQ